MNIIQRSYLKDFITLLSLLSAGFSAVFSVLEVIEKIGNFLPERMNIWRVGLMALYNFPRLFIYVLPMAVLVSSLFTFSQAARRKEIIAVRIAGGRLRSLFAPFIVIGVLISIVAFIAAEFAAPYCASLAMDLRNYAEGKTRKFSRTDTGIWLKARDGSPVKIDLYLPEQHLVRGLTIFVSGTEFLKERIVADSAVWNGAVWTLQNISRYDVATGKTETIASMPYPDLASPDLFGEEARGTDELGIVGLYRYTQRLREAGFRNKGLAVTLNAKVSFPLVNAFMMVLGISLSARLRLTGGVMGAGVGLIISLMYWLGFSFALSLGHAGVLQPWLAAWAVPLSFMGLATYLYVTLPE